MEMTFHFTIFLCLLIKERKGEKSISFQDIFLEFGGDCHIMKPRRRVARFLPPYLRRGSSVISTYIKQRSEMVHFHRAWKYVVNNNPIVYEKSQHGKNIVNYYTICPKLTLPKGESENVVSWFREHNLYYLMN